MDSWLFSAWMSRPASADSCMSRPTEAAASGMRCSLRNEEMVRSTSPSSSSMMRRRSAMNSLVAVEIWFLSLIQISLYTLIIMFRISVARWTFTS